MAFSATDIRSAHNGAAMEWDRILFSKKIKNA